MPFINLIAEQRVRQRARARKNRLWLFSFLGCAALSVSSVGFLLIKSEALEADIRSSEAQSQALRPVKEAIQQNVERLALLTPRLTTLTTAQKDTERWSRIFDHMSLIMPDDTWLTNVNAQQSADLAKAVEISWTGISREQNLVGDLMLRMQHSPDLQNVQLKYTETKTSAYGKGLEFQISTELAGTEAAAVAAKEALKS